VVQELAPSMAASNIGEVDVNGVPSHHYRSDLAGSDSLAELLSLPEDTDIPEQFMAEAWFASDGDWPVRLVIKSQATDSAGAPAAVEFVMELRNVNDAAIAIEPPAPPAGG
jgi:hypothetical protein